MEVLGPIERFILSEIVKTINNGTDEPISESVVVRLFGSITPIFKVSKPCSDASWTYLIALASLMSNPEQSEWALWTAPCKFLDLSPPKCERSLERVDSRTSSLFTE